MPNWAEQVTAIATAVSAIGLLSAIGAVIFAGQLTKQAGLANTGLSGQDNDAAPGSFGLNQPGPQRRHLHLAANHPFWLWLVWARWAWDLWLYRLLRTAVPGWVMRRIGQCMNAFGRDGTRITQDLDFEVARSAAS